MNGQVARLKGNPIVKVADRDRTNHPNSARPVHKSALFLVWMLVSCSFGQIGIGLAWTFSSLTYVTANEVNGTVVRTIQRPRGGIRPEVEYKVEDRFFVTRAICWTASSSYRIGDRVRVFYKPNDPAAARLDSFLELWALPLALNIFGTGLLLVWLPALRRIRLRRKLVSTPTGVNEPKT